MRRGVRWACCGGCLCGPPTALVTVPLVCIAAPLKSNASASIISAGGMSSPSQQKKLWDSRFVCEGSVWGMMRCAQMHLSCGFLTFLAGDRGSTTAQRLLPLLPPCASVFECGFGYGRDVIFLAKAGFTVYGIDPSEVGALPLMTSKSSLLCLCLVSLYLSRRLQSPMHLQDSRGPALLSPRNLHRFKIALSCTTRSVPTCPQACTALWMLSTAIAHCT